MSQPRTSDAPDLAEALELDGHLVTPASAAVALSGGAWRRARHLEELSFKLWSWVGGRTKRLMVLMPPQHGKSELCSHWTPVYGLAHNPGLRFGVASYAQEWAKHWGREIRRTIVTNIEHLGVGMVQDSKAAYRWSTLEGGGVYAAGIEGQWTGRPLDRLIIDDPVKDYAEGVSPHIQERNWNWWTTVARPRLRPDDCVLLVQTRWDEGDLAGRLLKAKKQGPGSEGYEDWEVYQLPAIAQKNDPLGRPDAGEITVEKIRTAEEQGKTFRIDPRCALWPEVFPADYLLKTLVVMGSHKFSALYQQSPYALEGNRVKRSWMKYYMVLPDPLDRMIQSWDTTFDDEEGSDRVSGQVWGTKGARSYLADRVNDRMDAPETIAAMRNMSRLWPKATLKLVEKAASGPAIVKLLQHELHGMKAVPVSGRRGKVQRFDAVAPFFEAGNVFLPDPSVAPWVVDFVEELCRFPNAEFDDDVDACSQALEELMGTTWRKVPEKERELPPEERAAEMKKLDSAAFWKSIQKAKDRAAGKGKEKRPARYRMLKG